MKFRTPTSCVCMMAILLSGCSLGVTGQAQRAVEGTTHDTAKYLEQARTPPLESATEHSVRFVDDVWSTNDVRRNEHGAPLPRRFQTPGVNLKRSSLVSLYDIGTIITEQTNIPVSFAPDAAAAAGTIADPGHGAAPGRPMTAPGMPTFAPPAPSDLNSLLKSVNATSSSTATDGTSIQALAETPSGMILDFSGRLSDFLDQVGSHFGVTWEYQDGGIRIFRNITRTFTVHALPLDLTLTSTMTTQSQTSASSGAVSVGGQTGGSNQNTTANITLKLWDDIKNTVTSIVNGAGQVSVGISTGTITITAPPEVMSRVQEYMDSENARLSKQVAVSVAVYSVTITDSDNNSFSLQGVFNKSSKYGFSFGNASTTQTLANLASATSGATVPGMAMNILSPTSAFNGSSSVVGALATLGRVDTITTTSVTTLNGIPAPIQVANTRGYLAQISVTNTAGTTGNTTSTALTPGSVTTGYNLSLLPRVSDTGDSLLMSFAINMSDLNGASNGFDEITSPDKSEMIQLPNVDSRSFVQQAEIPSGASLVLSGFEQSSDHAVKNGSGTPDNMLLGGSQVGSRSRVMIVIVMTPTILSNRFIETN